MDTSQVNIKPEGAGLWRIRAERKQGEQAAAGEVVVREAGATHAGLAGARAWQAIAQTSLQAGDADTAAAAARAGLEELGNEYYSRSLGVLDDTGQHIAKAEDQLEAGAVREAAERLLAVLRQRQNMYAQQHKAALAE